MTTATRDDGPRPRERTAGRGWQVLAAAEVVLAAVVVVADLLLPALVLLAVAGVSLAIRRHGPGTLGLRRPAVGWWVLARQMLAFATAWTVLSLAVFIPVANHLSGHRQDVSDFAEVEGNLGMLAVLVVLSWTLAAFCEEVAFRGYVLTRTRDLLGTGRAAVVAGVLVSAALFGLIHTEQGVVGVTLATLDGMAYAVLRLRFGTVLAPVLAHGFINTIGFVAFFFVGPVNGLW